MPRRPVRRTEAPAFVVDETEEFLALLRKGALAPVKDLLAAVPAEGAAHWLQAALDDRGRTALHHALEVPGEAMSQVQIVRFLCAQRADANAADGGGVTPLHLAAQHASKYSIRALFCAGADNLKRTLDGHSTVHYAQFNPNPTEAFEAVGWPGEGPLAQPLEPRKPGTETGKAAAVASGDAPPRCQDMDSKDSPSLAGPLLLTAGWFAFLAVVAAAVIRSV